MKWRSPFAMAVLAIILAPAALAARPYIHTLAVPPPESYSVEQLWNVTLKNPDTTRYEVWLEGTITEAKKGQVFRAKSKQFSLLPGDRVVKYADIHTIGIEKQTNARGYEQFAARTGGLPEGDYTFTVKLEPDFGSKSARFDVRPTGPPRLIKPQDGDSVFEKYPLFFWTPPVPALSGRMNYGIRIVEMLPGQTPEEAMRANPPRFEQQALTATSIRYPTSAQPLAPGKQHVWQVTASAPGMVGFASAPAAFQMAPAGALPKIVVPLKVNVLAGVVCTPEEEEGEAAWEKPVRKKVKELLVEQVAKANQEVFSQAGVELDFSADNINWDVEDPDATADGNMDRNYSGQDAQAVNGKANEELKKKFGDGKEVKGFKHYVVTELLNKGAGESGVGYWFPPKTPGFSVLEVGALWEGIAPFELLAHEICHGLGCLKDVKTEGNIMNPGKERGTGLTPEQIKQLRECAAKRAR